MPIEGIRVKLKRQKVLILLLSNLNSKKNVKYCLRFLNYLISLPGDLEKQRNIKNVLFTII